jgi:tetratricopeptide (TPR) repeat protein
MKARFRTAVVSLFVFITVGAIYSIGTRARPYGDTYHLPSGGHFDFMSRCTDATLPPEKRIHYCKQTIGNGAGIRADDGVLLLIGQAYREEQKYPEALETFEQILNHESEDASTNVNAAENLIAAYAERGITYAMSGEYDRAMADAQKVIQLAPDDATSFNNRCWTRAVAGRDLQEARADCDEALKRQTNFAAAFASRGLVEFKLDDFGAALNDYKAAFGRDNKMWASLYMKGIIEMRTGDAAEGDKDKAQALDHNPNLSVLLASFGVTK